jgi:excisionase family DNA binding protein
MAVTRQDQHSLLRSHRAEARRGDALAVGIPPEVVERIAERAAELVAEREAPREADGWLRGADAIAAYLDCPRSRVYALTSAGRIPVHHDGSALIARRSELDRWIREGGGRRP